MAGSTTRCKRFILNCSAMEQTNLPTVCARRLRTLSALVDRRGCRCSDPGLLARTGTPVTELLARG